MRRLSWPFLIWALASGVFAQTVRSDRFSENPLQLKMPGQEATENAEATAHTLATQEALTEPEVTAEVAGQNDVAGPSPAAILAATTAEEQAVGEATQDEAVFAPGPNAAAAEASPVVGPPESTPILPPPDGPAMMEGEEGESGAVSEEGRQLEQALDAAPVIILPTLAPSSSPFPFAVDEAEVSATATADAEILDEFDRGVALYKKTPDYVKSALREKSRFIFMSGNDNFLHGGFVALLGRKHASSGDDVGRTLSLEGQYIYQAPYAEWHFFAETVGITQLKYDAEGRPCYQNGKTMQYFMERDRLALDIRRRHQYGTVYWLGGFLLEYWTDRGFLAKPIQKRWHKTFERQGAVQYFNLDRGIDQTAFGSRSGLGVKELWNTAAYWDNIFKIEMVLEQMFSYKRRGSIGWTGEYTMTSGTWLERNLSNPALSLQFWGTYRRLFGGSDEGQGGVNLIYGFKGDGQQAWRVILGVNFNREWEDRYFGKYDKDHAFWYLGVDVIDFG